jgi:uncharacterized protein involved in exopolysaccharide biosynthesis
MTMPLKTMAVGRTLSQFVTNLEKKENKGKKAQTKTRLE